MVPTFSAGLAYNGGDDQTTAETRDELRSIRLQPGTHTLASAPGGEPAAPDGVAEAKRRVQLPALFLIAVAVLNLLYSCYFGFELVRSIVTPADQLLAFTRAQTEQMGKLFPAVQGVVKQQVAEMTADGLKKQAVIQNSICVAIALGAALLVLLGGIRMLQLRWYGVCLLASVVAAIPCISGSACCCMGEAVGVWAVVVLLSGPVRMAFR